jgi:fatty acid desaturase
MGAAAFESRDSIGRRKVAVGLDADIAQLRQLDDRRRIVDFVIFEGLWLVGAMLSLTGAQRADVWQWPLIVIGVLLSAIGLNANALLLHEGMHFTLFRSRMLNRCMSSLLGASVLISFNAYRVLHAGHHLYNGDKRDPDDYRRVSSNPRVLFFLQYLRLSIGAWVYIILIPLSAWRRGDRNDRIGLLQDYALMAFLFGLAWSFIPGWVILYAWFLPIVLVAWMTSIRGLTQHGLTDSEDPLTSSRTVLANPIVEFCLLSENYHLEHHLFPEIPSYNLSKLHQLIAPRLSRSILDTSYLGFLRKFLRAARRLDSQPVGLVESDDGKVQACKR